MGATKKRKISIEEARNRASLSASELAHLTGKVPLTIYRAMQRGDIPFALIGKNKLIPRSFFLKIFGEAE